MLVLVIFNHDLLKCGIVLLLPLVRLKIDLRWKFKTRNMAKTVSRKCSFKDSADKPLGKTPLGDKTPGLDPEICFHVLEDSDKTE